MAKKKFIFYFLWLSLICLAVFLLQISISGFTELFVLNSRAINNYEFWRFLTPIFLHGSLTHLVYNLFALLLFGFILERLIGSKRFLFVFLLSGIIANIIAVNFYESSLGASGAIYGIIGCITILKPFMMVWAFGLIMPMFIAAIVWILGDILGIFIPDGVGNIAHLSGILVGFIIGLIIRRLRNQKERKISNPRKSYNIIIPEPYIRGWEDRNMK